MDEQANSSLGTTRHIRPDGCELFLHFQPVLLDRLFPSFHHVISLSPDEAINGIFGRSG
jgi:hypothetical protein